LVLSDPSSSAAGNVLTLYTKASSVPYHPLGYKQLFMKKARDHLLELIPAQVMDFDLCLKLTGCHKELKEGTT